MFNCKINHPFYLIIIIELDIWILFVFIFVNSMKYCIYAMEMWQKILAGSQVWSQYIGVVSYNKPKLMTKYANVRWIISSHVFWTNTHDSWHSCGLKKWKFTAWDRGLTLTLFFWSSLIFFLYLLNTARQQVSGHLPAESDSQGGGSRGEGNVPHLCLLRELCDVRDPHPLQSRARHLDGPYTASCGKVRELP